MGSDRSVQRFFDILPECLETERLGDIGLCSELAHPVHFSAVASALTTIRGYPL